MTSLIILILGTFWEASMDIIASERNYRRSIWNRLANFFDKKGWHHIGQSYWDYKIAWRNKWKNGDPKQGERFLWSARMFATFMDGWHLMKCIWFLHLFSAIIAYQPMTDYPVLDIVIYYFVFGNFHSLFFHIMQIDPILEE